MGCDLIAATRCRLSTTFQSTHPVWDATSTSPVFTAPAVISIHAPRMGCDICDWRRMGRRFDFNPRTPYGMRPSHSLPASMLIFYFNPRTPYGMRPLLLADYFAMPLFQSTHPVWDATAIALPPFDKPPISIHAPRMGCDLYTRHLRHRFPYFNPRTPYGMRLQNYKAYLIYS